MKITVECKRTELESVEYTDDMNSRKETEEGGAQYLKKCWRLPDDAEVILIIDWKG